MKSFGAIRESEGTYKAYKVVVHFTVKGALRSFGKTFVFPLKGNATSNCLASFMCGGPCHLSHFKQSSGDFTVLFYSEMKNYWWINISEFVLLLIDIVWVRISSLKPYSASLTGSWRLNNQINESSPHVRIWEQVSFQMNSRSGEKQSHRMQLSFYHLNVVIRLVSSQWFKLRFNKWIRTLQHYCRWLYEYDLVECEVKLWVLYSVNKISLTLQT